MPEQDGRQLSFKLVYYGPAQRSKTSNLLRLADQHSQSEAALFTAPLGQA